MRRSRWGALLALMAQLSLGRPAASGQESAKPNEGPPSPIPSASYLSLDGLTLVIVFDKPVNLSAAVESVESRRAAMETLQVEHVKLSKTDQPLSASAEPRKSCLEQGGQAEPHQTQFLVQGIQLCAKLLTKKSLKLLRKYRLHNCLWSSQVQFLVQLGRPAAMKPVKISFQRGVISEHGPSEPAANERELSLELSMLPLEGLGVPLQPRVALTGPSQVPPCGLFSLTAHLSSPYGTSAGESVKLSWSVERTGQASTPSPVGPVANSSLAGPPSPPGAPDSGAELKWQALRQLVSSSRSNSLLLDARLLQPLPQLYQFQVTVAFVTSLTTLTLNATHQISKLDFDAPIGTIYGSHLLGQRQLLNPRQPLVLLAEVQVPECAANIKQVGLYWQVSDARVRFEQSYAPFYLARPNSLPEQSQIEFRLHLFYGIRVKKFASTSALLSTGESALDSHISDGLLIMSVGHDSGRQLELFGGLGDESDRYSFQWSCFDGKTAQSCLRSLKTAPSNNTRYEIGAGPEQPAGEGALARAVAPQTSGVQLIDAQRQRQPVLRLPLKWLDSDAQLWFGLQRFERQQPSQQSQTEYTLISVQPGQQATVAIGPVMLGPSRQRATVRNPLTGALVLLAGAPAVVVGRLGPSGSLRSFLWRAVNLVQPLHWTTRNTTNPLTGEQELLSELHLSARFLVPYAQLQVQLVACSWDGSVASASLNLDVAQGVSQCAVAVSRSALADSLVIAVENCNIPLGLSPVTYQIYAADTSHLDGHYSEQQQSAPEDEYTNESDELLLEDQLQPLTGAQLSPVFPLLGLDTPTLLVLLSRPNETESGTEQAGPAPEARVRFGARVCDRLQSCRMFYSASIGPRRLLPADVAANQSAAVERLEAAQQEPAPTSVARSLQSMVGLARRANLAGNSIAAISLLNAAINLGQRALYEASVDTNIGLNGQTAPLDSKQAGADEGGSTEERLRALLQVAMRDCLQYGQLAVQRQFHLTESGQTNLATNVMARILSSPQSGIEFKFKAIRLLAQLTRQSISEQLNLKLNCLADPKSIQSGYEALFGTFSHYSIDSNDKQSRHNDNNNRYNDSRFSSIASSSIISAIISNSSNPTASAQQRRQHQQRVAQTSATKTKAARKRREEAILAYLRSVRQAYRSLISAAAIQLPLGDEHQYRFIGDAELDRLSLPRSQSPPDTEISAQPSSEIISSLNHLAELSTNIVRLDLHGFGSVSLRLDERLLASLRTKVLGGRLRCRNATSQAASCSSFVLAVTTFAGKAPSRALDEGAVLAVPVIEVSLLSPVDGSNLLELQSLASDWQLEPGQHFKNRLTYTLPAADAERRALARELQDEYGCYYFDEAANEWVASEEPPEPVERGDEKERRISCAFSGLGVFGAFRGRPPSAEGSMELSLALVLLSVGGLVALLLVLGCMASSSRDKRSTKPDESATDEDASEQERPHPEQSHRSNFNRYPL